VATVSFDNFSADRQTNPIAGILSTSVQALKRRKNVLVVFGFDANAIVPNAQYDLLLLHRSRQMNGWRRVDAKFKRVTQ
jgi:hypothetical protein